MKCRRRPGSRPSRSPIRTMLPPCSPDGFAAALPVQNAFAAVPAGYPLPRTAARVALGPELPAFFCNDDKLAGVILRHGAAEGDPVWRLPLHKPYGQGLDSKVADLNNISGSPYAGAIVAYDGLELEIPYRHDDA